MCRFCTQPWAEGVGECMVGENDLRYHSPACYQSYLDGIAKVTPLNHSLHNSFTLLLKGKGEISLLPLDTFSKKIDYTISFVDC
jgi:hypothetical protein